MGFCLLGIGSMTPQGIAACLVQMFNHGLITAMLFILVGVVYDRAHTRSIAQVRRARGGDAALHGVRGARVHGVARAAGALRVLGRGAHVPRRVPELPRAHDDRGDGARHRGRRTTSGRSSAVPRQVPRASGESSAALEPFGGRFPDVTARELASLAPLARPHDRPRVLAGAALRAHRGGRARRDLVRESAGARPDCLALARRVARALDAPVTRRSPLDASRASATRSPEIALALGPLAVVAWDLVGAGWESGHAQGGRRSRSRSWRSRSRRGGARRGSR